MDRINWRLGISVEVNNVDWCIVLTKNSQGQIQNFQRGGGGPWDCKIGHAYKMSELEHTVKTIFAPEILALPQGRDYNELPVQKSFSVILITIFLSWV